MGEQVRTSEILRSLREELRALGAQAPGHPAPPPSQPSGLKELIQELEQRWTVHPRPFTSAVPVLGPAIARFRSLWNEVSTRWYVQPLFEQQMEFNASVLRLSRLTVNLLDALEGEVRDRWVDQAPYEHAQVSLTRSLAELNLALRRLETASPGETNATELAAIRARLARLESAQPAGPGAGAPTDPLTQVPPLDYPGFEERFRGTSDDLRERQRPYLAYLKTGGTVLDLGCGRGEFLDLLAEAGFRAQGVDADQGMVAAARDRDLDVVHGDLLAFLAEQQDASVDGIFSAQVVEHLPPDRIRALVYLSSQKLRPGGVLIAETVNPRCLLALSHNYTLDLSHRQPVHPDTLAFMAESYGFHPVEVRYCSPVPEGARLRYLPPSVGPEEWRTALNEGIRRLNDFLYGYQDYAVIAHRP